MTTIYPPDTCAPPITISHPSLMLSLHLRDNLLLECLPHLIEKEHGTRTSPVLRGLIADIQHVTRGIDG